MHVLLSMHAVKPVIDHMQLEFKAPVNRAAHHVRVVSAILSGKNIFESDGEVMGNG